MPAPAYKRCSKCGDIKPRSDFSRKTKSSSDGLQPYCKGCNSAINRKWRQENPRKAAAIERRAYENNREKWHERIEIHKKRHPQKAEARRLVKKGH